MPIVGKRSLLFLCLCVLVAVLFIAFRRKLADSRWEAHHQAGLDTFQQGSYAEAEKQLAASLQEAETFGPKDLRVASNLNSLGAAYHAQEEYIEAESAYRRSLAIREQQLGGSDYNVALNIVVPIVKTIFARQ